MERIEFLNWILELLDKLKSSNHEDGMLRILLPLCLQYLDEFVQSELLSRRLSHLCCKKLGQLALRGGLFPKEDSSSNLNIQLSSGGNPMLGVVSANNSGTLMNGSRNCNNTNISVNSNSNNNDSNINTTNSGTLQTSGNYMIGNSSNNQQMVSANVGQSTGNSVNNTGNNTSNNSNSNSNNNSASSASNNNNNNNINSNSSNNNVNNNSSNNQ